MESKELHAESGVDVQRDGDHVFLSRSGVTVRLLQPGDIEKVVLFRDQFLKLMQTPIEHDQDVTRGMLHSAAYSPCCIPLVAITPEGKIVGVMIAEAGPSLINGAYWVVAQKMFYVDPVVRGQGVGTALVRLVEEWAKVQSIDMVLMTVRHGQVPDDWFEDQGYAPIEQTFYRVVR